jgi:hypothetical protein
MKSKLIIVLGLIGVTIHAHQAKFGVIYELPFLLPTLLILLFILNVVSVTHTVNSNVANQIVVIQYGPLS